MRNIAFWIVLTGCISCGCGGERNAVPAAPSTFLPAPAPPQPPQPPAAPLPALGLFENAIPLAFGTGLERTARGRVSGGATYFIEVWSFLRPSGSFELTTSIEPR